MEKEYRYILNSKNKGTCPKCGKIKCFVFWYWRGTMQIVHEQCGVCDHVNGCGYKLSPWELSKEEQEAIRNNPNYSIERIHQLPTPVEKPFIPIPSEYVRKSQCVQQNEIIGCNLIKWLANLPFVDRLKLIEQLIRYYVGVTRSGDTIFWQIDEFRRVHGGKVMKYREDGHRFKDEHGNGSVGWIHSQLKNWGVLKPDWELKQTLFGMHLLNREENKGKPIAIVESEKTALICSLFKDDRIWMATGGLNNLKRDKLESIIQQRRKIILYPDRDGWQKWSEQAKELNYSNIVVSDYCERAATDEDGATADLADIIIRKMQSKTNNLNDVEIQLNLTEPHPMLRLLIETFQLT